MHPLVGAERASQPAPAAAGSGGEGVGRRARAPCIRLEAGRGQLLSGVWWHGASLSHCGKPHQASPSRDKHLIRSPQQRLLITPRPNNPTPHAPDHPQHYESKGEGACDGVAVVSAPAAAQRARVLARPGMTEEKLDAILKRQVGGRAAATRTARSPTPWCRPPL